MKNFEPSTYGESVAEVYDEIYSSIEEGLIELLIGLASGGTAFELGIGTGRIALPLVKNGIHVDGIDASESMVNKLKAKAGSESISVQIGDFSNFNTEEKYDLVYVVFNTFYSLLTQENQVSCFQSVFNALKPDGLFLIEAFVPDMTRFSSGQRVSTSRIGIGQIQLDCVQLDLKNQILNSQMVRITETGIKMVPVSVRYAWPSELDLMARFTGFELHERWSSWKKETFTSVSKSHVSVYKKLH